MMSRKKCCVPGCLESGSSHQTMHLFPNPAKDRERLNQWVFSIGGDIVGLDNEDIYKHRSVCHAHFEEKFICRFNRLSNIAVPTLNLPGAESVYDSDQLEIAANVNLAESVVVEDATTQPHVSEEPPANINAVDCLNNSILGLEEQTPLKHQAEAISKPSTSKEVNENILETQKKWAEWKPMSLKSKKHPALCKQKVTRPFDKLAESKLEIAELQKKLIEEEFEEKLLKKQLIKEEMQRKNELHNLEKEQMLLKIEILKAELEYKRKL